MHLRRAAAQAIFPYFSKVQWNILQNLLSFWDVDCGRTTKKKNGLGSADGFPTIIFTIGCWYDFLEN